MANKVMLITGGSRGIGAATAKLAAARGYDVCIAYAAAATAAEDVVKHIESRGTRALAVHCDVSIEAEVNALFAAADKAFGPIDVLVNSAGIAGKMGPIASFEAADIERLLKVNVLGTLICAREAVKRMSTKLGGKGGAIVNVSSIASRLGAANMATHYAASKGAIDSFTVGLAREVADQGIRVNQVSPGMIATDMQPMARREAASKMVPMMRLGQPEEIAETILWLASIAASYVTAANVDASGGR